MMVSIRVCTLCLQPETIIDCRFFDRSKTSMLEMPKIAKNIGIFYIFRYFSGKLTMNLKTETCKVGPKSGSTEGYFKELRFP